MGNFCNSSVSFDSSKKQRNIRPNSDSEDTSMCPPFSWHYYSFAFALIFLVLISYSGSILLGASGVRKPQVTMTSIRFDSFAIQAGTVAISMNVTMKLTYSNTATIYTFHVTSAPSIKLDSFAIQAAVGTDMFSMNATVKFTNQQTTTSFSVQATSSPRIKFYDLRVEDTSAGTDMISMIATGKFIYRNTATFSGVYVTSSPVDVSFSELTIGSGAMKKFYLSRNSQRVVVVPVIGNKITLYGCGARLSTATGITPLPVPLKLNFTLQSRSYVLGRAMKPRFYKTIDCLVTVHPQKPNVAIPLKDCTYVDY